MAAVGRNAGHADVPLQSHDDGNGDDDGGGGGDDIVEDGVDDEPLLAVAPVGWVKAAFSML